MTATAGLFVALLIGAIATIVCLVGIAAFAFHIFVKTVKDDHNGNSR